MMKMICSLVAMVLISGCTTRFVFISVEAREGSMVDTEALFEADQDGGAGDNNGNSAELDIPLIK
jgi:hypothetical protein